MKSFSLFSAVQSVRILAAREDFGLRWQSAAATPFFGPQSASESGVALRFPPHSKKVGLRLGRAALVALLLAGMNLARAAWPDASSAVVLKGGETPEQLQEAYTQAINVLAPQLGFGRNSQQALRKFEATVHHAARPDAEPERVACCKAVAAALQGEASTEAKCWMLQLIQFIGRAEVVPAEAKLLNDPEPRVRETARGALQHNPAKEAATALRAALVKSADPSWQAALVLALGTRKDVGSVSTIVRLLRAKDEGVVNAALFALGSIADAQAQLALASALKTVPETSRATATEAYLKCLEKAVKAGQGATVEPVYRRLYEQPGQPRPVRLAALQGMLRSAGDNAARTVLEILSGEGADARAVALGFIPDLGSGGLKILAAELGKLPVVTQTLLLSMLAERGEKSALPVALSFASSTNEEVRLAGLTALSRLGDASSVGVLVEAMQAGGNPAGMAKESLARLNASGVNEAILTAMQSEKDSGRRAALVEVIEARGAAVAVPALLQEAVSDHAGVRRAAMRGLGKLAQPKDLPAMARGLLKAGPGGERDDAEKALAIVCARVPEPGKQGEPVLALYREASPADRLALLPVLGRLGGSNALETIKTALASTDTATYEAGIAAISNWPDSDEAVEGELRTLAQKAEKSADRAAALRAYIRVISLPSGLADLEKLKKFQKAMDLAERDDERKLVLERVGDIRRVETLRFVALSLDKAALAQRAGTTIVEMARDRGFRDRNKADFDQALNKIVDVCKDQGLVDRAKRRLAEK